MTVRSPTTNPLIAGTPSPTWANSPLEYVRVLFVSFFQELFAAKPPGGYHWVDGEQSEIYITDENPIHDETIGSRPCLSLTRGPVQFYSLGFDDMLGYDQRTGTKRKSVLIPGTLTVNCSSRVALECERLAWVCAESVWMYRDFLMKKGFFDMGMRPGIGAPSPAGSIIAGDSGDEWSVVPVTFPFQFVRTSQISPLNQKVVKAIDLSLQTRLQALPAPASGPEPELGVEFPPPFAPHASDAHGATPQPGIEYKDQGILLPHPLNPAKMVVMRSGTPGKPVHAQPHFKNRRLRGIE